MRSDLRYAGQLSFTDCTTVGVINGYGTCHDSLWGKEGDAIFDVRGRGGKQHQAPEYPTRARAPGSIRGTHQERWHARDDR